MDKRVQGFLHTIVKTAHGSALPKSIEDKMVSDLNIQLEGKLHDLVLAELKDDWTKLQYQSLIMDTPSPLTFKEFLQQHIPDVDKKFTECMEKFRDEYLKVCQVAK